MGVMQQIDQKMRAPIETQLKAWYIAMRKTRVWLLYPGPAVHQEAWLFVLANSGAPERPDELESDGGRWDRSKLIGLVGVHEVVAAVYCRILQQKQPCREGESWAEQRLTAVILA
jgi:hypothetical protein